MALRFFIFKSINPSSKRLGYIAIRSYLPNPFSRLQFPLASSGTLRTLSSLSGKTPLLRGNKKDQKKPKGKTGKADRDQDEDEDEEDQEREQQKGKGKAKGKEKQTQRESEGEDLSTTVYSESMKKVFEKLQKNYSGLQIGRADPQLVQGITIEGHGKTLSSVAQVNIRDRNSLLVSLHDPSLATAVSDSIRNANLGLTATVDGSIIIVNVPKPTSEYKETLVRKASEMRESGKVDIRKVRKEALDKLKKLNKPKDEDKRLQNEVQKLTDSWSKKLDDAFKEKEKEINK